MRLSVVSGPDAGYAFDVRPRQIIRVGRGVICEVLLRDPSVSRVQFEIHAEEGRARLLDEGSRWGTLVNGVRTAAHELHAGDVIRVGETELQWTFDRRPEATTVAPRQPVPELPPVESPPGLDAPGVAQFGTANQLIPSALIGRPFDHFLIQGIKAEAQSGVVFLALDRDANSVVALKIFRPELMQNSGAMRRFLRAIQTMQPCRHANLVMMLTAGVTGGLCWSASEFVDGESAKQIIRRVGVAGMLDWQIVHRLAVDIARALEYAAGLHLVHRNITPTNILVRRSDGVAKLGDLYLARAIDELGPGQVTRAGEIIGDLTFLSPEQTSGGRIDHRSDLYGLGATLYALLTGRPPLEGLTTVETVHNIQTQLPKAPKSYHLGIPDLFEAVVLRLLAKRPDDRYADATQLLRDLERVGKYTRRVDAH